MVANLLLTVVLEVLKRVSEVEDAVSFACELVCELGDDGWRLVVFDASLMFRRSEYDCAVFLGVVEELDCLVDAEPAVLLE